MLHSISGRANKQDAVRLRSKTHGLLRGNSLGHLMPFANGRAAVVRARALSPAR